MNVSLTPALEAFIRAKVESGLYNNASEVVRAALRALIERDNASSREISRREPTGEKPTLPSVLSRLRDMKAGLQEKGVDSMHVVGSVARGDAGAGSDVDLLVAMRPDSAMDLFELSGLRLDLEDALGHGVDVILDQALDPRVESEMRRDAVAVF